MNAHRTRHGTPTRYSAGCRCAECRAAAKTAGAVQRRNAKAKGLHPLDPRHGTVNGRKNYGCTCARCLNAGKVLTNG